MNWPKNSLVRKGLAIRLDHNAAMIFDTDLVRFAAGVKDGWLDISETDYTSYKGAGTAKIEGKEVFASSEIAGWAKNGSFDARREDGMGNLPTDWAHYKGYYRYGDKVLLSYSVGETDVLELPEAVKYDGSLVFTRTMRISTTDKSMDALILKKHDSWSVDRITDLGIILDTGVSKLAVCLANAPDGVKLEEDETGLLTLHVPQSDSIQIIKVLIFELSSPDDTLFSELPETLRNTGIPDFEAIIQGGPTQWDKKIKTPGVLSDDHSGYVVDHIPVPFDNPWGSWMRLSGIAFFDDGKRAAITTWNGDVWIVSGIDKTLENVKWHRFASGLFYSMGVVIVKGDIYVTERSQLTRLHDLNGDGEADYYENFNNDGIVYPRALTLGLKVDSEGYFYFFKNGNRVPSDIPQHGALIRVSPDGTKREVYARGFRSANTLGIGPDDKIITVDQQGNWVPVDRMNIIKRKGGFYGARRHGSKGLQVGEFDVPIVWIPYGIDNSAGFLTFVGDSRWGPLAGHWIMGSYGQRTLFSVLLEKVGDGLQGGVVKLPQIKSQSGVMRASVNSTDGQLYMVGLHGWQTTAKVDGSFERVRYAGGNVNIPKSLHITPTGVKIVFTSRVDPTDARNVQNYKVERWEYNYSKNYGSPEMSLAHPGQKGHDSVEVSSVILHKGGREIFLKIPDIQSVMQMKITLNLRFKDGQKIKNTIYNTVNWLSEADTDKNPEWQQRIISENNDSVKKVDKEIIPKGKRLLSKNDCNSCHAVNTKLVGPSFLEIARKYSNNQKIIDQLSTKIIRGGSGNWGQQVMTPHPDITKKEARKIVQYILSFSKNSNQ